MSAVPSWAVPRNPSAGLGSSASDGSTIGIGASPGVGSRRRHSVGGVFAEPQTPQNLSMSTGSASALAGNSSSPTRKAGSSLSEFEQDAHIWVTDSDEVWISGKISRSKSGETSIIVDVQEGEDERKIVATSASRGLRRNVELLGDGALRFDDLTEVPILHEAAVLQALDVRFEHGIIYTLSGPVLLAVNPFRTLPGLYSPQTLCSFVGEEKLKPHVFSVANHAYQGIRQQGESQTVLVSGESGSGKTETTKFVMQFLALAGAEAVLTNGNSGKPLSKVEKQVLGSNPLLEAFGNAKTLRNDNSSRFGKYTELQFGHDNADDKKNCLAPRLVGARVHTYLLEQVRVTDQAGGERSFHIFYQMLAAARDSSAASMDDKDAALEDKSRERVLSAVSNFSETLANETLVAELDLHSVAECSAQDFAYLRRSAQVRLTNGDDCQDFSGTLGALRTVGFSRQELVDVFRLLAAVLHLGNMEFEAPVRNSEGSMATPGAALDATCERLGVTKEQLEGALCVRSIQSPEGMIRMANTVQQAAECRDATARTLYNTTFRSVVHRVNQSIGYREDAPAFCGVLDIFGFEFFEVNSFEQLCINFTNELLQQYFNTFIFTKEEELYHEEGITWTPLDFPDNSAIVLLLQQPPTGILPMLDEECFVISGSSTAWETKMIKTHEKEPRFRVIKHKAGSFIIEHFAGPVMYTTEGFMEKNKDRMGADVLRCMTNSSSEYLRKLFEDYAAKMGDENAAATPGGGKSAPSYAGRRHSVAAAPSSEKPRTVRRVTVSSEFRGQLKDLMTQIRSTKPHFVRCIKPNNHCKAFDSCVVPGKRGMVNKPCFNRKSVAEQLNYQGVLEAIRVARAGYPVRFIHSEFYAEFRVLACKNDREEMEAEVKKLADADPPGADTRIVQKLLNLPEVQALLPPDETMTDGAVRVQWAIGNTKVFLKQDAFGAIKAAQSRIRNAAARKIEARFRGLRMRKVARRRWAALISIQAHARGRAARLRVRDLRRSRAGRVIATVWCTLVAQRNLRCKRLVARAGQSWLRMRRARLKYSANRAHIVRLQAWWRSSIKRRRFRSLPKRILGIQRVWRGHRGRREALEWKARRHRLLRAVRSLVRIRRKQIAHRRWRARVMQAYRGVSAPLEAVPAGGDGSDVMTKLVKEYALLEHRNLLHHDKVAFLRRQNEKKRAEVKTAKGHFFPSLGF